MTFQHGDPIWMELSTPDLAATRQFYSAVFGWAFSGPDPETGQVEALVDGRPVAGLTESSQGVAEWRVYLQAEDVARTIGNVVRCGGRILLAPLRQGDRGTQVVVESPAGAMFSLYQPQEFTGFALGRSRGYPVWFELLSSNFLASLAFFRDLLGWQYHFVGEDGIMSTIRGPESRFATNGPSGQATAGVVDGFYECVGDYTSHFRSYIAVDSLEEALAAACGLGGYASGRERSHALGRAVEVTDPFGAEVTFLQPREEG